MRRFSVSIEDRILQMPAGEDGKGGPPPPGKKGMSDAEREAAYKKELESNDAVYEQMVRNIEKAKERFEIESAALKKMESMSRLEQERLTLTESRLNQMRIEAQSLESLVEMAEKLGKFDEDAQSLAKERLKSLIEEYDLSVAIANEYDIALASTANITVLREKILNTDGSIKELSLENLKAIKEQLKLVSKDSEADKARVNALEESQKKMDGIGKKILGNTKLSSDASETMLGSFQGMLAGAEKLAGEKKGMGLLTKQFGNTFSSAFNLSNVLFKAFEFSFDLAQQIEKISKDLGKATGFGNVFAQQIGDIGDNLTMIGGDEQSASEIIRSMSDNISSFNPTAHRMNVNLSTSIFKLKQFGVSTSTSAKMIDVLERAMGLTADQAVEMTSQIAIMGRKLGITTEKMVGNFNTAYERITIFGSQGNSMFKELSAQVKATGLEMSRLLDISKKFDKFSTSADQVAQLNAALGTNLSSLEMLNATDSERIEIIRKEVRSSVGNFDSLGKYEKLYIQQAMGVNSVAEAQRLLNMSQSEYLSNQSKQQEAADAQAELAKNASELVPALTKLSLLIIKFFKLFTPLVGAFQFVGLIIDEFFALFPAGTDMTKGLAAGLEVLKFALIAFGAYLLFATAPISAWVIGISAAVGVLYKLYEILHRPGSNSMASGLFHKDIGSSIKKMTGSMNNATGAIHGTSEALEGLHASSHNIEGSKFDITAMAKMDTAKIAAGIKSVKSALQELSTLKIDGFIAMTTDGNKSSFAVASEGVIKSLSEGRLTVDVNMPELTLPPIKVVIESKGTNLADFIDARVEKRGIA